MVSNIDNVLVTGATVCIQEKMERQGQTNNPH